MNLKPHIGVSDIQFGLKRSEVRELLSAYEANRSLGALTESWMPSDDYQSLGFSIKYTKFDRSGAVLLTEESEASLKTTNLFELNWEALIEFLQKQDPNVEHGSDFIFSKLLGLSIACHPDLPKAESVLAFHPEFYTIFSGAPNPSKVTSFSLQVGFVEDANIKTTKLSVLEDLGDTVFSSTKEKGIILWNAVPIPIDYHKDFPSLIRNITPILMEMHWAERGDALLSLKTENLDFGWRIHWQGEELEIDSVWRKVPANYQKVLGTLALKKVKMTKTQFMAEWKMPLVQFDRAIEAHGIEFVQLDSQDIQLQVVDLISYITGIGRFYQNVPETEFTYRKDRSKFWKLFLMACLIIGGSFIALYFITQNEEQDAFWWIKKYWFSLLLIIISTIAFLLVAPFLLRKR